MLTARPTKRDKTNRFSPNLLFDIFDDDKPFGNLAFDKGPLTAIITLGGKTYTMAHDPSGDDERAYQALTRVLAGREKPQLQPWALKDSAGQTLALAQLMMGKDFAVSRGDESFSLRKRSRPHHLYRQGSDQSLGSVGQEKFFTTTLHMRLPPEFDPAFQVFLLLLPLSLMFLNLGRATT
jgi:hypothetical protein